ncbi:MAG: endonuclease [Abditibacteriota bacterium]|nr:endonuclease [Abditibacteriota bacterium]
MPEGPEVRRYADALNAALCNQPLVAIMARTKAAKAWLLEHPQTLLGRRFERVRSHGKNLIIDLEGDFHFLSHLMMWGRWQLLAKSELPGLLPIDRRERARLETPDTLAILMSAPVFDIAPGDPYENFPYLRELGPDILPYDGEATFLQSTFTERLLAKTQRERTIGAALLDQTVVAGIGNYLRAEILFECRLDPWRRIGALAPEELQCLSATIPLMARRAYDSGGATIEDESRERMRGDPSLVYAPGRDWGMRHYVFRRTNLPCLRCGDTIRQLRQTTRVIDDDEKTRIIYFCPTCQNTSIELKPLRKSKRAEAPRRSAASDALVVDAFVVDALVSDTAIG